MALTLSPISQKVKELGLNDVGLHFFLVVYVIKALDLLIAFQSRPKHVLVSIIWQRVLSPHLYATFRPTSPCLLPSSPLENQPLLKYITKSKPVFGKPQHQYENTGIVQDTERFIWWLLEVVCQWSGSTEKKPRALGAEKTKVSSQSTD